MLIKHSTVLLTDKDMEEYHDGKVSERLQDIWHLTYQELKQIIENNNYEKI